MCANLTGCVAWKYAVGGHNKGQCRLLPGRPTHQEFDSTFISGSSSSIAPTTPLLLPPLSGPSSSSSRLSCNVTEYGAVGDGKTVNTASIMAALAACERVVFPAPGVYLSGTLFLVSNRVLDIAEGAVLRGADGHFARPKSNPWDAYQDYGHSHWRDSFIVGEAVANVTLTGGGTIDGGGVLATGEPKKAGSGCRLIALKSCLDIALTGGLHLRQGGWFTLLATNVTGLLLEDLDVIAVRDGFDVVGCRNVLVQRVRVEGGGDDAMVLKSDYSLGGVLLTKNVTVRDSVFGSGCNALQFGSETVGDFEAVRFSHINVTSAGKAGIGLVTMDGAHIRDVSYSNIHMANTVTPLYFYIGARMRRPQAKFAAPSAAAAVATLSRISSHSANTNSENSRHYDLNYGRATSTTAAAITATSSTDIAATAAFSPGSISDISLRDVTAINCKGPRGTWAATFDGQPVDVDSKHNVTRVHLVGPNISLTRIDFSHCYQGGGSKSDSTREPPHPPDSYPPRDLGIRPAYGLFVRRAEGIFFQNVSLGRRAKGRRRNGGSGYDDDGLVMVQIKSEQPEEARPAVVVESATDIEFAALSLQSRDAGAVDYDVGLRNGADGTRVIDSPGVVVKNV